jgi:hypothetical protein
MKTALSKPKDARSRDVEQAVAQRQTVLRLRLKTRPRRPLSDSHGVRCRGDALEREPEIPLEHCVALA